MERLGRKYLAWTFVLGLGLFLVVVLIATGESNRRAEMASPFAKAVEPELPLHRATVDTTYHNPGLANWMTP